MARIFPSTKRVWCLHRYILSFTSPLLCTSSRLQYLL